MDELNALKASIIKQWGQIPTEIANELADLEKILSTPPPEPPVEEKPNE